jgi:hypothetical protein
MNKSHPMESFGVFKPVGHTVITFATDADQQQTADALSAQGFADSEMLRYSPAEMVAQVDAELAKASVLAPFGYEITLIKAHRIQAENGCSFLVVYAPDQERSDRVLALAKVHRGISALRYGTLLIEEIADLALHDTSVV